MEYQNGNHPTKRTPRQTTSGQGQPDGWGAFFGVVLSFSTPSLPVAVRFQTFLSPAIGQRSQNLVPLTMFDDPVIVKSVYLGK
jgi:hypothetical protein